MLTISRMQRTPWAAFTQAAASVCAPLHVSSVGTLLAMPETPRDFYKAFILLLKTRVFLSSVKIQKREERNRCPQCSAAHQPAGVDVAGWCADCAGEQRCSQ